MHDSWLEDNSFASIPFTYFLGTIIEAKTVRHGPDLKEFTDL